MSKDDLAELANRDTPSAVSVPSNWPGLIAWMLGRFGIGVGVAIVFGWFTVRIYEDLQTQNANILEAFRQQTHAQSANVAALQELTRTIDEAHRRADSNR